MARKFFIDPDIRKASTLPSSFYRDPGIFRTLKEKVFYRSWQWIGDDRVLEDTPSAHPFVLLPEFLDEPMVLTRDAAGKVHCLSNVCTHRGNLVASRSAKARKLICGYHGRRFAMDGSFVGQNTLGCNSIGQFAIIDAGFNLYEVQSTISDCAQAGDYIGLAFLGDLLVPNDTLILANDNGSRAFLTGFEK